MWRGSGYAEKHLASGVAPVPFPDDGEEHVDGDPNPALQGIGRDARERTYAQVLPDPPESDSTCYLEPWISATVLAGRSRFPLRKTRLLPRFGSRHPVRGGLLAWARRQVPMSRRLAHASWANAMPWTGSGS